MALPLLRLSNLGMSFGARHLFQGVDLEAEPGDLIALKGPNGSGKTTLLRCLTTLILPSEGDAWVGGHSVRSQARSVKSLIGWVPAMDGGFFPRLNGRENLEFFGALRRLSHREIECRLDQWRAFGPVRLALETPYYLCSSGMKQILHVVRALLPDPAVLLLDEPTRSLDVETATAFRTILREIAERRVILFSTHSSDDSRLAAKEIRLGIERIP